jgi:dephospho-CoA kinase
LSCPEFQFDVIHEYASPALKLELRKLSREDQSEAEKLKQIVRMNEWLISRRFDFVRKDIRMMLGRGFRRQRMGTVIAELRLLRRQQSKRHFPAIILDRSEIAPEKASAVIE